MQWVNRVLAGMVLLFGAGLVQAAGTRGAAPEAERWLVPAYDVARIESRCPKELERARAQRARMEGRRDAGNILAEWNRLSASVQDFVHPVYLLANVSMDATVRETARKCVETFAPLDSEMFQSERLFARVSALKPRDAIDALYRKDLLEAFEDAGIALPAAQRARIKAIREELERVSLQFQHNVNEDRTTVAVTPAEAEGLPAPWIAARKRDEEGRLIVTLDSPTYSAFLDNAVDADARRRVWTAKLQEGGAANLQLLDRALALRHEMARIYGYPDYATFSLRRTMAKTPAAVQDFLGRVRQAVDAGEQRELAELRADKAELLKLPVETVRLERWDVSFHQERIRRARFDVDQEVLRAYFPTEASVAFGLKLAQRLYGVRFVARDVPRWSPDVRYYDVHDANAQGGAGARIGAIYLDLFPREGKYNHAAAFTLRSVSARLGRKPVSALVANLDQRGLTQEEMQTLLHEFGHVLHGVLSRTRYVDQGGTSVKRDFVEAPSQMFEEWARRDEPLALFAQICPSCPRLTPQMTARLRQADRFGSGIRYARQWQYASYDMRLHSGSPPPAMQAWRELEQSTRLGHVEGTMLPASFGHLLGSYAAGYYGYMWSQVLGLDMLSGFKGRMLDPAVGRRYRDTILASGGQRPPEELVRSFLGRAPGSEAFFAEISGTRD
jgi:thimet oligopeptidase